MLVREAFVRGLDISAHSILLNRQASRAMCQVTSSRMRREDRCSISSFLSRRPWRGMGSQPCMIAPLNSSFLLFDRAAGLSLHPDRRMLRPARARGLSRLTRFRATRRSSALRSIEHDGTTRTVGLLTRSWEVGSGIFPDLEVATVMQHTPGDARASLLASAIASTLWCSRFAGGLDPGLEAVALPARRASRTTRAACTNSIRR